MAYTTIDDPSAFFQCTLYAGNNGTQTITHGGNSDLQADLIWGKARNDTAAHFRIDSVRGVSKRFKQNADAESTVSTGITAIGSDSFALGNDGDFNDNSVNYATWNWKAGTSFTNDASSTGIGSIDSAGSFNNDAGFSIATWTGNGTAGATIKHGLNSVPSMMIIKNREAAEDWIVFHQSLGNGKFAYLSTTAAAGTDDGAWNDTSPTSSVFTIGDYGNVNTNNQDYICYAFSEKKGYSKFGSYTGNGNADGTFVYTGFKPAMVMYKNTSQADDWFLSDSKRLGYNPDNHYLRPSLSAAEGDPPDRINLFSNGFKLTTSDKGANASGDVYIYMAFAENPFVTSTGVPATAR